MPNNVLQPTAQPLRGFAATELEALACLYGFAADLGEAISPTGYPQELFNIAFLGFKKINQLVEVS